ncbi:MULTISPECIES: PAS domain S-box protein [unclassified Arcicella]|uniref:sensor histidine kinase n=1 Tax=unclassified Arcicella TaxID=2644986 RepID=UPI002859CC84|nr:MULTISPECIES: PAS domain S-box protein [unclassified Arcicella]MDR6562145.1 PAS domain S-box-containing protein [Arcicella sp. BE51]MDR6812160.1 PAS domain S-box-containing protein [Arcicella sp. BE140]MDR6823472.1 PAS domain S-box-containing protein [Arcicella sp. BE139]
MTTQDNLLLLSQEALDILIDPVCILDSECTFVFFNKAYTVFFKELYGYFPEIGSKRLTDTDTLFSSVAPTNVSRGLSGERFKTTHEAKGKYYEFYINPVFNSNQIVTHLIIYSKDVTEKEQLIRKVYEQEEKYQYVIENVHEVLFQTDIVGNLTFLNKAWVDILGYNIEESSSKPFYAFLHPDDIKKNILLFRSLVNQQKTSCSHIVRFISKTNEIIWIKVFISLLMNEKKEAIGTTGTLRDITNEKSNAHFSELLSSNVRDLICICNLQGQYLYVSPSCKEVLGYEPKELIGKNVYDYFYPEDIEGVQKKHERYLLEGNMESLIEYRFLKKTGEYVWMQTSYKMFFDEYNLEDRIVSSSREITLKKKAEESMMNALKKEKELNQLKTRFVAMTTHQFKTPLSTISSSAEIIEMFLEEQKDNPIKEKIKKQLNTIHTEIISITNLMNETLFLGKIEDENRDVQKMEIDLVSLIYYGIERQNRHQKDGRKLVFEQIGKQRKVLADPQHLEHIIDNLLSNAFKYSPKCESPIITLCFKENEYVIEVKDYGIGIPINQHKKVYTSFFRGANVGGIKGTGLGLLIVHNLVKMNGGEITFESEENVGTTFRITFPYS